MAELKFSTVEKELLRALASQVAAFAARPEEKAKAELWTRHNDLGSTRPLVFCHPENGWNEILPALMSCKSKLGRAIEWQLVQRLFWAEQMGDDKVTDAFYDIGHIYTEKNSMKEIYVRAEEAGGAYGWEASMADYEMLSGLELPKIKIHKIITTLYKNFSQDIFGDILDVRIKTRWYWSPRLTRHAVFLRGMEQFFVDMYDYPGDVHRMMRFITDSFLHKLDYLEKHTLLYLNNGNDYVGSGGFGFTKELPAEGFSGKVRTSDMWGFNESQETVSMSPSMFEEFIFPYQLEIAERFGLNCYGCCEPLESRIEIVKRLPGLRRISVSAWADFREVAETLGDKYILSYKPNPAYLAGSEINEAAVRKDLAGKIKIARENNCRLEIIMKDNHTIGKNPQNVTDWCRIAKELL